MLNQYCAKLSSIICSAPPLIHIYNDNPTGLQLRLLQHFIALEPTGSIHFTKYPFSMICMLIYFHLQFAAKMLVHFAQVCLLSFLLLFSIRMFYVWKWVTLKFNFCHSYTLWMWMWMVFFFFARQAKIKCSVLRALVH